MGLVNSILATIRFELSRVMTVQRVCVALIMVMFPPAMIFILEKSGALQVPEFNICLGLPCPDGVCPGGAETCEDGICVAAPPANQRDAGPVDGDDLADLSSGCGCAAPTSTRRLPSLSLLAFSSCSSDG